MDLELIRKGANEVVDRLLNSMKDTSGYVHPQSFLCCLGSLAGYSCQYDVRELYIKPKGLEEDMVFNIVEDYQGRTYFYGDMLNKPVAEDQYSVWSLCAGALCQMGAEVIDLRDIFTHVSSVVGGEEFGKVRNCVTGETMEGYLKLLWKPLLPLCDKYAESGELHILYGVAIQKAMRICKDAVDLEEIARIVMESVVSMSKVTLP